MAGSSLRRFSPGSKGGIRWTLSVFPGTGLPVRCGSLLQEAASQDWREGDGRGRRPIVSSQRKDGSYRIAVELPGVKREDINLKVGERMLSISAQRKPLFDNEGGETSYSYQLQLAPDTDQEHIDADYCDGLLLVTPHQRKDQGFREVTVKG